MRLRRVRSRLRYQTFGADTLDDNLRPNFVAPIGANERPWWWRSDCYFGR